VFGATQPRLELPQFAPISAGLVAGPLWCAGLAAANAAGEAAHDVGTSLRDGKTEDVSDMTSFLVAEWLDKPIWMWAGFLTLVIALLAFDLGIWHKDDKEMGISESLWLSAFYFGISIAYGAAIWWAYSNGHITTQDGTHAGVTFFTGFFIEKALSIDNVFVISLIFGFFAIPRKYQYRALVWGILAVIVLRGIMIAVGAALVQEYSWVLYIFGAFLIATGIKMLVVPEAEPDVSKNPVVRFMKKRMRVTDELHDQYFFVKKPDPITGKMVSWATPLFLALVVINVADLIFAVDSVPAIFAITTDTFIVYTANIMAILGLRALYFALSAMVHRFEYLKYALALVLVFIGAKIFWNQLVGKLDPAISLGVTVTIIAGGILFSLWKTRGQEPHRNPII
jgi:tellurite resistance protein TerC